jgi:hypothetical protein
MMLRTLLNPCMKLFNNYLVPVKLVKTICLTKDDSLKYKLFD